MDRPSSDFASRGPSIDVVGKIPFLVLCSPCAGTHMDADHHTHASFPAGYLGTNSREFSNLLPGRPICYGNHHVTERTLKWASGGFCWQ